MPQRRQRLPRPPAAAAPSPSPGPGRNRYPQLPPSTPPHNRSPTPLRPGQVPTTPQLIWAGIGSRGNRQEPIPPAVLSRHDRARRAEWQTPAGISLPEAQTAPIRGLRGRYARSTSGPIWLPWPRLQRPLRTRLPDADRTRPPPGMPRELAERLHPAWDKLQRWRPASSTPGTVAILLGPQPRTVRSMPLACWTEGGAAARVAPLMGLRIAAWSTTSLSSISAP